MTLRYFGRCIVLLSVIALDTSLAHAAWTSGPVTILETTALIPKVSACNDGGLGTLVAWQQESAANQGVVRVQHVMPRGFIDPTWPADGVLVCDALAQRPVLGTVPDGVGGAYVWWLEGSDDVHARSLYLTRVVNGEVAPGWPARGRLLGTAQGKHVSAIADGAQGVYLAWPSSIDGPWRILGIHLGPSNAGAGGWWNAPRTLSPDAGGTALDVWPQLALAPDGGVFVAWASLNWEAEPQPSIWYLSRVTTAGGPSPIVSAPEELGTFDREAIIYDYQFPDGALIDVCPDGRGGVFVLLADPLYTGMEPQVLPRLLRLQGDAAPALDWPAGGTWFTAMREPWDLHLDRRVRVLPDGNDGAITGHSRIVSHGIDYRFHRFDAAGTATLEIWGGEPEGLEVVRKGSSGLIVADYDPSGPNGQYDGPAHLTVRESTPPAPATMWWEWYEESGWLRYGDIGLAETGDGGAILFWSQSRERFGLFARRFGPPGPTTDVAPATPASLDLTALRFVAGRGLVAALTLPDGVAGRLELFDLSGRRVATAELAAGAQGSREIAVRSDAPRGVYFARLTAGGISVGRKVAQLEP